MNSTLALTAALLCACGAPIPEQTDTSVKQDLRLGDRVHMLPKNVRMRPESELTSAASANTLTYYGGRVVSNIQVVEVLWGSGSYLSNVSSTGSNSISSFYTNVTASAYFDWLDSEYNTVSPAPAGNSTKTNQHIGRGTFKGQYTITPSITSSTIDDSQIQTELADQIAAGHLPAPTKDAAGNNNTYYAVFFPHGKTITQGGSSSCVEFCAYHGTVASAGSAGEIFYGVHPDMQSGSGCESGCGNGSAFANYTSVASHEMIETVTDCEVGLATTNAPPLAWYNNTNGELGDICHAQQGTITGADGVTYTVQKEWSNGSNACITSKTVSTNDFSLSTSPTSLNIQAGSSGSSSISTAVTTGSAQSISLTVTGQPSGMTASFSPTSVTAGGSSTLSISTTSATTAGTYTLTVKGTATSGSHTAAITVTVTGTTVSNDFSISASPSSVSIAQGASGSSSINTAVTSGSAQTVSLSVSGAPSGVTATLSPTSVSAGQSSTLSIAANSSAAAGSYTLTINGSAASGSHSTSVALTITSSGGGGGGNVLSNGVPVSGISGALNSQVVYTIAVPANQSSLVVKITGSSSASSDAGLYVRAGAAPTTSTYDCRPYLTGSNETCTLTPPAAGTTYYIMLNGYTAYSGVTLTATYTGSGGGGGGGNVLTNGVPVSNLSGAKSSTTTYTLAVPSSASTVAFTIAGSSSSSNDADMYVKFGSAPTTSSYDCRPYLVGSNESCNLTAKSGTWYVMIRGYTAYSGVTL
ncbi:MAG: PPC domain-containing protein, partial [Deltaproteobacteria bacterium]|nr:PPC domain-containing protein [Deltaproteobacteria bacterium]